METKLSSLSRMELRSVWKNEATDFTPWLAQEENFTTLATALHLFDAEVVGTEQSVGAFSADIIAKDRDGQILIENQLEQTDHGHLGQIMTYLAGVDGTSKVIWISPKFREEHRAAIDWLNDHTSSEFSFFGVEIELIRIEDSPPAPLFHVVAKPNSWTRHLDQRRKELATRPLTDGQAFYLDFWSGLAKHAADQNVSEFTSNPPKDHWWNQPIGRADFSLTVSASIRHKWIAAEIYIADDPDKSIIDHFHGQSDELEAVIPFPVSWERLEERKGSRIALRRPGLDPSITDRWPEYFDWYVKAVTQLRSAFGQRIRELNIEETRASRS